MPKKTYITTPIYYVNSVPHVGHLLTMLVCDVAKRFHKMLGEEVVFLTGTDENGLKVYEAALQAGEDPMKFVDRISQVFRDAAHELDIDYDIFFRTTSPEHKLAVQALFQRIRDNGFIYEAKYEGWYDVSAETFVRESDLVDGKSPDGNEVRWVSEDNYFFKLSAFGDRLLEHAERHPEFWLPEGRKAEVVSFIKQGLRDICITRKSSGWGIPVPGEEDKVIYVWFDALINYLAATGWPNDGWETMWPADIHWMAKEIFTRFHATLWPAMLMAANLPLPTTVIAHGWFTFKDEKMSKSKGNVLASKDLIDRFLEAGCRRELAVDAARYSLIRCLPFDDDTNFSMGEVERLFNADLANDLGNALNRTINMAHKFVGGVVPPAKLDDGILDTVLQAKGAYQEAFRQHRAHVALDTALGLSRALNRYVDSAKPWELAKNGDPRVQEVLYSMLFLLRSAEALARPFMPAVADQMAAQMGQDPLKLWASVGSLESLEPGRALAQPEPMFPRIDLNAAKAAPKPKEEKKMETPAAAVAEPISIEDFMKVELRVARILEAEPVEKSSKLMKLQVMIGSERRQILAGIKKDYGVEDLIGRQVIVVANLRPAKLMGMESQGMVLAADGPDGGAILLQPEAEAPEGTLVH